MHLGSVRSLPDVWGYVLVGCNLIDKEMTSLQRGGPVLLLYGCICPIS